MISCSDPYSDLLSRYLVLRCIGHWAKVAETLYVSLIHWGNVGGFYCLIVGFAIVIGCPFPVWLYYRGEQMRARNTLTSASVKKPSVIPQATNEKEPAEPA